MGYSIKPIKFFMRVYDIEGNYDTGNFPITANINRILLCTLKRSAMKQSNHESEFEAFIQKTTEFSFGNTNIQLTMILSKSYARRIQECQEKK